jgi:Flp pilus assembly protein TadD
MGHCLGLSVAYLSMTTRLGLPVFGVAVPGHFFCRFDNGSFRQNIELTTGGNALTDRVYADRYGVTSAQQAQGFYLANLERREVVAEILNNRANALFEAGDLSRATRDLEWVFRLSPRSPKGLAGRGFVLLRAGNFAEAIPFLQQALDLDPTDVRAYVFLGDAFVRSGQFDHALATLARASNLDPTSALVFSNLGRALARRGTFHEALKAHDRAIALDPESVTAWNNLGVTCALRGAEGEARAAFLETLALDPEFLPGLENLALLERSSTGPFRAWRSRVRAMRAYQRRLALNPGDAVLHATFARFVVETRGSTAIAREHAERAFALFPKAVVALEALALVASVEGDSDRSRKLRREADSPRI